MDSPYKNLDSKSDDIDNSVIAGQVQFAACAAISDRFQTTRQSSEQIALNKQTPPSANEDDGMLAQAMKSESEVVGARPLTPPTLQATTLDNLVRRNARWALVKMVQIDLATVRLASICTQNRLLRRSAITLSRLGNGTIYAVLPIFILARFGKGAFDIIGIAAGNIAVLHSFYPALKRWIGRLRPYEVDHQVPSLLDVLDKHSFPSGHVMTLAAALVPIFCVEPGSIAYGAGLLIAMGWARIATGHHYPTDVIAGAFLAFAVSYPLSLVWLSE